MIADDPVRSRERSGPALVVWSGNFWTAFPKGECPDSEVVCRCFLPGRPCAPGKAKLGHEREHHVSGSDIIRARSDAFGNFRNSNRRRMATCFICLKVAVKVVGPGEARRESRDGDDRNSLDTCSRITRDGDNDRNSSDPRSRSSYGRDSRGHGDRSQSHGQ